MMLINNNKIITVHLRSSKIKCIILIVIRVVHTNIYTNMTIIKLKSKKYIKL